MTNLYVSGLAWFGASAPQDHVDVWISRGSDNAGYPIPVNPQETMSSLGGLYPINRCLKVSICAVFHAHGHRKPAGHLPMGL